MTGLPPKIVWTMTYSHRPHSVRRHVTSDEFFSLLYCSLFSPSEVFVTFCLNSFTTTFRIYLPISICNWILLKSNIYQHHFHPFHLYFKSPFIFTPFNLPIADQDLTVITDRLHPGGCLFNSGTRPVYKRTHTHQHSILSFQCKPFSYGGHGKYIDLISQDRENTAEVNMAREIIKPVFGLQDVSVFNTIVSRWLTMVTDDGVEHRNVLKSKLLPLPPDLSNDQ